MARYEEMKWQFAFPIPVAQISNLLYRRIPFGMRGKCEGVGIFLVRSGLEIRDTAG